MEDEKEVHSRVYVAGPDSNDPGLLNSDLAAETPALFEERLGRFQHLRSSFKTNEDWEYFLMLPVSDNVRFSILSKLKAEGKEPMTDDPTVRTRETVDPTPRKTQRTVSE